MERNTKNKDFAEWRKNKGRRGVGGGCKVTRTELVRLMELEEGAGGRNSREIRTVNKGKCMNLKWMIAPWDTKTLEKRGIFFVMMWL